MIIHNKEYSHLGFLKEVCQVVALRARRRIVLQAHHDRRDLLEDIAGEFFRFWGQAALGHLSDI